MKNIELNINFKKYPYRGIIGETAKELGITRQAVYNGLLNSPNPTVVAIVKKKVSKRLKEVNFSEVVA